MVRTKSRQGVDVGRISSLDLKGLVVLILNGTSSDKDLELKMQKLNKSYTISKEKGGWRVSKTGTKTK